MIKYPSQFLWLSLFFISVLAFIAHRSFGPSSYGKTFLVVWILPLQALVFVATIALSLKYQALSWSLVLSTTAIATAASAIITYLASCSFALGEQGGEILFAHIGIALLIPCGYAVFFGIWAGTKFFSS